MPPLRVNVSNCPSTLTTTASDGVSLGQTPPATIHDTAHLTVPLGTTGDIRFRLYDSQADCATATDIKFESINESVNGPGNYDSANFTPTVAGTYFWTAEFIPDPNQGVNPAGPTACDDAAEAVVVNPAEPTLVTDADDSATLPDVTIGDTATLSGATSDATGTITFTAYGPFTNPDASTDTCDEANLVYTSDPIDIGSPNPQGEYTVSNAPPFTPTDAGRYQWVASYTSGDDNNTDVSTECKDANEQSVVNPAEPTLVTDADDSATLGDEIGDTATLSGATSDATGTITFTAYGPFTNPDASTDTCDEANLVYTSDPIDIGSPNPQGEYTVSNAPPFTPTDAGRYQWVASYTSGDDNNTDVSTECKDANEQSVVNPAEPTLVTDADDSATLGDEIGDTATLSGATSDATGTITFTAYGPFTNPDASTDTCDEANLVYTSDPIDIGSPNPQGEYTVSNAPPFTPTDVGRYQWVASYTSGDDNNTDVSTECKDANEQSVVSQAPSTISTAQTFIPQDEATVSSGPAGSPLGSGTVEFKLYGTLDDCQANNANTLYTETVSVSGNSPQTVSTNNDGDPGDGDAGYTVNAANAGSLFWRVTYSGTTSIAGSSSACVEDSTVTIDDTTAPPTP